jgi:hypothetical protein
MPSKFGSIAPAIRVAKKIWQHFPSISMSIKNLAAFPQHFYVDQKFGSISPVFQWSKHLAHLPAVVITDL